MAAFTLSAFLCVVALSIGWTQQTTPDFAGEWGFDATLSDDRAAADRLVVVQTSRIITLRRTLCCRQAGEEWTTTYHFNGGGRVMLDRFEAPRQRRAWTASRHRHGGTAQRCSCMPGPNSTGKAAASTSGV